MASVSGLMGSTRERIKIFQWVGKIEAIVMSRHIRYLFLRMIFMMRFKKCNTLVF